MTHTTIRALVFLALLAHSAPGDEAVTIRLIRPDRQLERVIGLFEGSRAANPAAALSAWKRANPRARGFGKRDEALIAFLNPEMVRELATFDDAVLALRLEPGTGRVRWSLAVPRDDGTLAALATALALTDGGSDPPLDGRPVDRLGPPGAALLAQEGGHVAVAGVRDDLAGALDRARARPEPAAIESGTVLRLLPARLEPAGPVAQRRLIEALRALAGRELVGLARLGDDELTVTFTTASDADPAPEPALDPAWLDWFPTETTAAVAALAFDPRPEARDAAFAAADRIDRADPGAAAGLAPLRTRLNLLAAGAGLRPEVDLWPHLRGISAGAFQGADGSISGGLIALHMDGAPVAERIVARLKSRPDPGAADGPRRLGTFEGRPLLLDRRDATVLVAWGDSALEVALESKAHPGRSAAAQLQPSWGPRPPARAGAAWPGRLPGLVAGGSPAARALDDAPPVVWSGGRDDAGTRDILRTTGLRGVVRRFLELIPLEPPTPAPR